MVLIDSLTVFAIASEAVYEKPWTGPMLFSIGRSLLLPSVSIHKKKLGPCLAYNVC